MLLVGGCAILISLRTGTRETRDRLLRLTMEIGASCALAAFIAAPYLYFFFANGFPTQPLWSSAMYSADLLNFIVPTSAKRPGPSRRWEKSHRTFPVTSSNKAHASEFR